MGERRQKDELLGLARQLATSSGSVRLQLAELQAQPDRLNSAIWALTQATKSNDLLLTSASNALRLQAQFSIKMPQVAAIIDANQSLARLVEQISLPKSAIGEAFSAQAAVKDFVAAVGLKQSLATSLIKLDTSRMLAASLVAQQQLEVLSRHQVGKLLNADTTFRRSIGAHLGRVTRAYSVLMTATEHQDAPSNDLAFAAAFPPIDYYRHLDALESITLLPDEGTALSGNVRASIDQSVPTVDNMLLLYEPDLYPLLLGARGSIESQNPDSPRHVMTSLRELVTHALHRLAPDDDVKTWSADTQHYHQGRPTRRARMLYVCRDVNNGPLVDFIQADVAAGLALVDLLNRSTHAVQACLTPKQLRSLLARVESLLSFLLQLRGGGPTAS